MKMKSLLFPYLAGVLLVIGGISGSAQDDTNAPASSDSQLNLDMFSSPTWHINLGMEFPGAKGTFATIDQNGGKVGDLNFDFSNGGVYVAGVGEIEIPDGYSEFRVRVKSAAEQKIVIRFIDSTKQCLQYPLSYTDVGNWQLLRVDMKDPAPISFNGANDKVVHFPVAEVWLGLEKSAGGPVGEAFFKDGVVLK